MFDLTDRGYANRIRYDSFTTSLHTGKSIDENEQSEVMPTVAGSEPLVQRALSLLQSGLCFRLRNRDIDLSYLLIWSQSC